MNRRIAGTRTLLGAGTGVCVLVVLMALAGVASGSGGPKASASASVKKQIKGFEKSIKTLKGQVSKLQGQVGQLSKQPGRPGAQGSPGAPGAPGGPGAPGAQGGQGPAGTAPACQGNGSGDEMVAAGSVCIDRYEVSVWSSPKGGTQYGASSDDYPAACADNGQGCKAGTAGAIYARSVPGVKPSVYITYFQAQQALANSGKRLPSNAEWQQAVAGTPDSNACQISGSAASTGANAGCVSNFGANDMVGNVEEWVADWVPASTTCKGWGAFSDDVMCLSGASTMSTSPGALLRGGFFGLGTFAGPFAVDGRAQPLDPSIDVGFRGAR